MSIHVFFTPREIDPAVVADAQAVVIDVVRATTSMVEALAHGARGIYPTGSTEGAVRLAASLGREDTLLCGERRGLKVEGFDLGNSPAEFVEDAVDGRRLVWSTTNGTPAFAGVEDAADVMAAAFTNLSAVAAEVRDAERLVIVCAGAADRFGLDDALCAGHLVRRVLAARDGEPTLGDAARAAALLAAATEPSVEVLERTAAGRALAEIGLAADLEICAQVDRHAVVPRMRDGALTARS